MDLEMQALPLWNHSLLSRKGRDSKYDSQGGGAAAAAAPAAEEGCRAGSLTSGSSEADDRGATRLRAQGCSQEDTYMEAAAMQDEKAMCLSDIERPKSCREKFLQAWNEKLKLQQHPLSSQVPECQAAIGIPTQGQMTRDKSLSLRRASLQPNENVVYFLTVAPASQGQRHLGPVSSLATEHCLQQLSMASYKTDQDFLDKELASSHLNWETNTEEEFLQICTSDLLLECPVRKRPRLLPPNRKMHVEVRKTLTSYPLPDSARSPIPLEYSHQLNTMSITNPPNIPEVESMYHRFTSKQLEKQGSCRSDRPGYQLAECLSPVWGINASPSEQAVGKTDRMRLEQPPLLPLSLKGCVPSLDLEVAAKSSMNLSRLPPKKRYTRSCL